MRCSNNPQVVIKPAVYFTVGTQALKKGVSFPFNLPLTCHFINKMNESLARNLRIKSSQHQYQPTHHSQQQYQSTQAIANQQ